MRGERSSGSFQSLHFIDGARYEVVAHHDGRGFARFDVHDEHGQRINEEYVMRRPPSELTVGALIRRWRARRTVLVRPSEEGWVVSWAGQCVALALDQPWWPE